MTVLALDILRLIALTKKASIIYSISIKFPITWYNNKYDKFNYKINEIVSIFEFESCLFRTVGSLESFKSEITMCQNLSSKFLNKKRKNLNEQFEALTNVESDAKLVLCKNEQNWENINSYFSPTFDKLGFTEPLLYQTKSISPFIVCNCIVHRTKEFFFFQITLQILPICRSR